MSRQSRFFLFYHTVLSAQTCRFPDETKKNPRTENWWCARCTLVRRIVKEGHNVVCVSTDLSWFETCVGACSCASSNSLQKNQCNTNEPLSPPLLVCLRQVHSLLWHAHKRCRVGPLIVANHFGGGGVGAEGERRSVEDARWDKRRGVLLSHSRVPLARPTMLRRLSRTAPAS